MIVISDSTPIISLTKIGMLGALGTFYNEVLIPNAVYNEVCSNPEFSDEANVIKKSSFIKVQAVNNEQSVKILRASGLDLGESEAIVLADSLTNSLLLMDERKGRQIAQSMGIKITGTLGILIQAKKSGMVNEIKPLLDALLNANVRISEALYNSILKQVDE